MISISMYNGERLHLLSANLPSAESLISRLVVMAGVPLARKGERRGEHVLRAMQALVPNLHDQLVTVWDEVIPKLLSKLTGRC